MRQIDRESRLRSSSDPPESWLSVAMRGLFIVYELLDLEQYLYFGLFWGYQSPLRVLSAVLAPVFGPT